MSYYCNEDDAQLYFSFSSDGFSKLCTLQNCLKAIKDWMSEFFQLWQKIIGFVSISVKTQLCIGPLTANVKRASKTM